MYNAPRTLPSVAKSPAAHLLCLAKRAMAMRAMASVRMGNVWGEGKCKEGASAKVPGLSSLRW